MAALSAQPLPGMQAEQEDQWSFTVTRRDRMQILYGGSAIRVFYAVCMLLTILLVVWTAVTGDRRPWWVWSLEAMLTFLFAAEVGARVYLHPLGVRQSVTVMVEVALSAVCIIIWIMSELLKASVDLDELDDALLGLRYGAQSVRIVYFARAQWVQSGQRQAQFVDIAPDADQEAGGLLSTVSRSSGSGPSPGMVSGAAEASRPDTDFSLFLRDCVLNDRPLDHDPAITPKRAPVACPSPPSPLQDEYP
eukprot:TRINITY_DN37348_c0_g1_i1.p1 TRINITY_DN37348_c0_g1~~TRINITY_DN37348_c0_g1_i1.p1  ORF type:complete len:249 (+),score=40.72 TRINITY_DN37348_c0_g1_i1:106-852(+)